MKQSEQRLGSLREVSQRFDERTFLRLGKAFIIGGVKYGLRSEDEAVAECFVWEGSWVPHFDIVFHGGLKLEKMRKEYIIHKFKTLQPAGIKVQKGNRISKVCSIAFVII